MCQTKVVEKIKTHILSSVTILKNPAIYEIMRKKSVQPGRPQTTIWCMHIACWIPTAKGTDSKYVALIAFPLQHWLHIHASVLHYMYIACLVIVAGICIAAKKYKSVHCCHGNAKIGFFALLSHRTFCAPVNNKYYIL